MIREGYHTGRRQQYRYVPISYPQRKPLIHAMRTDQDGQTVCFQRPEGWTRIPDADVTCRKCIRWIQTKAAERVAP